MHNIKINNKSYQLPGHWNELTKEQMIDFCTLSRKEISPDVYRLKLLCLFLGIDSKLFNRLTAPQVLELTDCLAFLEDISVLTRNLFPVFQNKECILAGPADLLLTSTFDEYYFADIYFNLYTKSQKESDLDIFCATLYRDEILTDNPDDKRAPFWKYNHAETSKKLEKFDISLKLFVYYFFWGCKNYIALKFPKVFSKTTDTTTEHDHFEYYRMINNLNNGDLTNNEYVKRANLYETFTHLEQRIIENEKLNEKIK